MKSCVLHHKIFSLLLIFSLVSCYAQLIAQTPQWNLSGSDIFNINGNNIWMGNGGTYLTPQSLVHIYDNHLITALTIHSGSTFQETSVAPYIGQWYSNGAARLNFFLGDHDPMTNANEPFWRAGHIQGIDAGYFSRTLGVGQNTGEIDFYTDNGIGGANSPIYTMGMRNGNLAIGTGPNSTAKLQVDGGSVLFSGTSGTAPASGAGQRMMWIPSKYAFRAGKADGSEWDNSNIGSASFAFGIDAQAAADHSIAIGNHISIPSTTSHAVVIGYGLNSSGLLTPPIGSSLSVGFNSTVPTFFVGEANGSPGSWGSVGIATTTPVNRFDVNGSVAIGSGYAGTVGKEAPTDGLLVEGIVGIGTFSPVSLLSVSGGVSIGSTYASAATAAPTDGLLVEGTVGIGTSSPASLLSISGGVSVGSAYVATAAPTDGMIVEGKVGIGFSTLGTNSTTDVYMLEVNGEAFAVTNWTVSDARLKQNVQPINDALQKILALRGVTYDFRREDHPEINLPDGRQVGVIAQELEEVLPELVQEGVKGFKAVSYPNLTAVLIEAMKEQNGNVEGLSSENESLRHDIKVLRDESSAIRQENDELRRDNNDMRDRLEEVEKILGITTTSKGPKLGSAK